MKVYDSNKLRNVAILGHSGSGKSNLIDALAYTTNISKKMPKISDKVNMTYSIGLAPIEHNGVKYNFLDTPGYFDFSGEVISALRASDAAIIVIDATSVPGRGHSTRSLILMHYPNVLGIRYPEQLEAEFDEMVTLDQDGLFPGFRGNLEGIE